MMIEKLDIIQGLFVNPAAVIRRVSPEKHFGLALFVIAISVISSSVGYLLPPQQNITPSLFITTLFIGTAFLLLFLFILCGVLSMVAGFYGGVGNVRFFYVATCLCLIPYWLVTPIALLLSYFELPYLVHSVLFFLARIVFFFWAAGLFVISIKETYVFSTGKAVATLLTPVAAMWILLIVGLVLLISIMAPVISELSVFLH